MEQNKPNLNKTKEGQVMSPEERKKLDKIVSGTVKTKKRNGFQKFIGNVVTDKASNIKHHIIEDIAIPTIKQAISSTMDMILYGKSRKPGTNASRISYRSYYDDPRPSRFDSQPRLGYSYDDVILETRGEGELVLSQMNDLIDTYGVVSVADLYDLVGISGNYTDNNYGWTNIRNAEVVRERDGYSLKLPKALPIK